MQITINTPNGKPRTIQISKELEAHWRVPINHSQTILDQINSGMYDRFFEGKKDMVCMDFGANVGLVSLYMLPVCRKLLCIEPTPAHSNLLFQLITQQVNPQQTKVVFFDSALSDNDGEVIFMTGHSTENKITSSDGYGNGKIVVKSHPLSYYLGTSYGGDEVDFCKIDIEGGEIKALTVEQLKLAKVKVKSFFVEVHPAYNGGMDENREELIKRFHEAGYQTEVIDYQTIYAHDN